MACWSGWSEFHPDEDRLFNSPTRDALAHGRLFLPQEVAFAKRTLGLPLEALGHGRVVLAEEVGFGKGNLGRPREALRYDVRGAEVGAAPGPGGAGLAG